MKNYSIDPYFGKIYTNISDKNGDYLINTQTGYYSGICFTRYFKYRDKNRYLISLKNSLNSSNYNNVNPHFGNKFYSFELLFGFGW